MSPEQQNNVLIGLAQEIGGLAATQKQMLVAQKNINEKIETVKKVITSMQNRLSMVSDSEHHEHHTWIEARIKEYNERADFWHQVRVGLAKRGVVWTTIAVVAAVFMLVGFKGQAWTLARHIVGGLQ